MAAPRPNDREHAEETLRKSAMAEAYFRERVRGHLKTGTWGTVTISAVMEAGYCKEVRLDDSAVVRKLDAERGQKDMPP